jgi:putative phage-type endonuclease
MSDRMNGLGSTDIVELAGLSPYQGASPVRVYGKKIGLLPEEDGRSSEEKEWGKWMERHILDWYEEQTGSVFVQSLRVQSQKHPWLWATPDARGGNEDDEWVEAKNVGSFMAHHWRRDDDDGIPDYVRAQVQLGMYCAEAKRWTVIACIGGLPPRVYRVDYDAELAERLVEIGRVAWEGILARREPPMDGSSSARDYLRAKYPRVEVEKVESSFAHEDLARLRMEAAATEKSAKSEKERLDNLILSEMGGTGVMIGDGWKMSWKVGANGKRMQRFTAAREESES